jgi:hypothetical protein
VDLGARLERRHGERAGPTDRGIVERHEHRCILSIRDKNKMRGGESQSIGVDPQSCWYAGSCAGAAAGPAQRAFALGARPTCYRSVGGRYAIDPSDRPEIRQVARVAVDNQPRQLRACLGLALDDDGFSHHHETFLAGRLIGRL